MFKNPIQYRIPVNDWANKMAVKILSNPRSTLNPTIIRPAEAATDILLYRHSLSTLQVYLHSGEDFVLQYFRGGVFRSLYHSHKYTV